MLSICLSVCLSVASLSLDHLFSLTFVLSVKKVYREEERLRWQLWQAATHRVRWRGWVRSWRRRMATRRRWRPDSSTRRRWRRWDDLSDCRQALTPARTSRTRTDWAVSAQRNSSATIFLYAACNNPASSKDCHHCLSLNRLACQLTDWSRYCTLCPKK